MAPQFPLLQLGTLLARQLSKPAADKIKRFAVAHPLFRRWVCAGAARVHHVLQLRLRLGTLSLRQPRVPPPLSEQTALNSGAEILGELAVLGLGGLIVVFEVNRQSDKQDDKILEEESQRLAVQLSLAELRRELALQQQDIERLRAALRRLAAQHHRGVPRPAVSPSPSLPPSASATPPTPTSPPAQMTATSAPPKSECPTPPTSERPPSPESECPRTPTLDCAPPPILECPKPVTSK